MAPLSLEHHNVIRLLSEFKTLALCVWTQNNAHEVLRKHIVQSQSVRKNLKKKITAGDRICNTILALLDYLMLVYPDEGMENKSYPWKPWPLKSKDGKTEIIPAKVIQEYMQLRYIVPVYIGNSLIYGKNAKKYFSKDKHTSKTYYSDILDFVVREKRHIIIALLEYFPNYTLVKTTLNHHRFVGEFMQILTDICYPKVKQNLTIFVSYEQNAGKSTFLAALNNLFDGSIIQAKSNMNNHKFQIDNAIGNHDRLCCLDEVNKDGFGWMAEARGLFDKLAPQTCEFKGKQHFKVEASELPYFVAATNDVSNMLGTRAEDPADAKITETERNNMKLLKARARVFVWQGKSFKTGANTPGYGGLDIAAFLISMLTGDCDVNKTRLVDITIDNKSWRPSAYIHSFLVRTMNEKAPMYPQSKNEGFQKSYLKTDPSFT